MPVEFWILLIPLLFLVTDFIANFVSSHTDTIKFDRILENIQAHVLLRATSLLALIPLTPLYILAQQHKVYPLDNSMLNIALVIVIYDFSFYWYHRLSHHAKPLWIMHVVHHQPEQLEASVALRESFLSPMLSWVLAVPLIYIGFPGEVVVSAFLIHTFYQVPCHNHWFPRIKWLEYLLITPSLHRVHHGKNEAYLDKNFGNMFSVWDRLFKTLQAETEGKVQVGVKDNPSHNIFLANLQLIFKWPAAELKKDYSISNPLLTIIGVLNVIFLVVVFYFYYMQPAYLLAAASLSVMLFVFSRKNLPHIHIKKHKISDSLLSELREEGRK